MIWISERRFRRTTAIWLDEIRRALEERRSQRFKSRFGGAIEEVRMPAKQPTDVPIVYVKKDSIIGVLELSEDGARIGLRISLRSHGDRRAPREPRFEVVYNLFSPATSARIRVKVRVARRRRVSDRDSGLAGRELGRARSLGHVRHSISRAIRIFAAF